MRSRVGNATVTEHAPDQEALAAVPALDSPAPAGPALGGAGGLAAAIGNQAFGAQYGLGAAGSPLASAGDVLARAVFADPGSATHVPWTSLRSEAAQARDTIALLRPREALGVDRALESGLASAASERRIARQPHDGANGTAAAPSGIDWAGFFTGDVMAGLRMGMEIGRVWPGVGAWTGLASDVTGTIADIATISGEKAPIMKFALFIRGLMNAANNFLGHISYMGQLASKATLISGVAAWVTPIIDGINMTAKEFKFVFDMALGMVDLVIWAAAEQERLHATTPESAKPWT